MRSSRTTFLALLCALLGPVASADAARNPTASRALWATVNICDTAENPNAVGVRASMPGSLRRGHRMLLRIRIQYLDGARWRYVGRAGDSGTLLAGSGKRNVVQLGQTFAYRPGATPRQFRAVVQYRWKRGARTVYRATRVSEAGHANAREGDPLGYSAETCVIA